MEEKELENGEWLWTFCSKEDKETYKALERLATAYGVDLNSQEFNDLFVKLLEEGIERFENGEFPKEGILLKENVDEVRNS